MFSPLRWQRRCFRAFYGFNELSLAYHSIGGLTGRDKKGFIPMVMKRNNF